MPAYTSTINNYIQYLDVSESTKRVYKYNVSDFCMWLRRNGIDLGNINRNDFINYKKYLVDNYDSIFTIRNKFTMIKKFIDHLSNDGILRNNITYGVKRPKYEKKLCKMPLTPEEVTKLLNVIDITKQTGLRDYCIIYLMIITGLRISEALSIKPEDISLSNNIYFINIKGKGCSIKSQQVFFEHGQNDTLDGYIECAVNEYLFVNSRDVSKNICSRNMQRRIKAYFTEIGLNGKFYTTHSLRHTTATILLEKGINIVDIQGYMRHTSVNTTQIYTAYMQNKKLKSLNISSIINKSIL